MDYLSEDENDTNTQEELTFDEMYPDEEMDEETMHLLLSKVKDNDDLDGLTNSNKPKEKKTKILKKLKTLNEVIDEITPKKWTSVRAANKKQPVIEVVKRRQFNPKLPPYKLIQKDRKINEKLNIKDTTSFPDL